MEARPQARFSSILDIVVICQMFEIFILHDCLRYSCVCCFYVIVCDMILSSGFGWLREICSERLFVYECLLHVFY